MRDKIHERLTTLVEDAGEKESALLLSATLTCILLVCSFFKMRLYPFGGYTLIYADGGQYAAFYRTVIDGVKNGESLLYSFKMVAGGGLLPTIAYYAASPFNLLFLLFNNNMVAGITAVASARFVAAAITFCILLNARTEKIAQHAGRHLTLLPSVLMRGVFSACYAFISYMTFFAWNLSWMDGVIVLPLMTLGIFRLIETKKPFLYIFSLAYALISNYYIGYMLCIASVILYVFYHFFHTEEVGQLRLSFKNSALRYALASLTGGALSAFLLLPVVFYLPEDRMRTADEAYGSMRGIFNFTRFFSGFFTGRTDIQSDNLPLVYFGVIPFVLIVCYLFDKSVTLYKKAVLAAFAGIFFLSFWNSAINTIWHGMSVNAWFNYRYSFIFSFAMLYAAYIALHRVRARSIPFRHLTVGIAVFFAWVINDTMGLFYAKEIMFDVLQIVLGILLLRLITSRQEEEKREQALPYVLLSLLMLVGCYMNTVAVMSQDVRSSHLSSQFDDAIALRKAAVSEVRERDTDVFYRMDFTEFFTRNDPFLIGYHGISNYASTENLSVLKAMKTYGLQQDWFYANYNANVPYAADVLFGMKYLLGTSAAPHKILTEAGQSGPFLIMQNPDALPPVFLAKELPQVTKGSDPFSALNEVYHRMTDTDYGQVFAIVHPTITHDEDGNVHLTCPGIKNNGDALYVTLPQGASSVTVYADAEPLYPMLPSQTEVIAESGEPFIYDLTGRAYLADLAYIEEQSLYYIGTFPAGCEVELEVSVAADAHFDPQAVIFGMEQAKTVSQYAKDVLKRAPYITRRTDAHLTAEADVPYDMILATTIPFDPGWKITVDGAQVQAERYMDLFLAVPLAQGKHTIQMTYLPRGLKIGALISGCALLALIAFVVNGRKNGVNGTAQADDLP